MQTTRPVFLRLWQIRLPLPGVVSILHRVSGLLLVLAIPFALALFAQALSGPEGFAASAAALGRWEVRLLLLVLVWGLIHHLVAGLRYLLLDLGIGLERLAARRSARLVLIATAVILVVVVFWHGVVR